MYYDIVHSGVMAIYMKTGCCLQKLQLNLCQLAHSLQKIYQLQSGCSLADRRTSSSSLLLSPWSSCHALRLQLDLKEQRTCTCQRPNHEWSSDAPCSATAWWSHRRSPDFCCWGIPFPGQTWTLSTTHWSALAVCYPGRPSLVRGMSWPMPHQPASEDCAWAKTVAM